MTTGNDHDMFCPKKTDKKASCICEILEKVRFQGYKSAFIEMSWQCDECGNTYDYSVDYCPNRVMDELFLIEKHHGRQ